MDASFPLPVFTGDAPLYDQLYRHIAGAVQSGALSPGARLPSKRRMCALAGVSMSTVEAAYSLLAAEGYVLARPRSGYVCAHLLLLHLGGGRVRLPLLLLGQDHQGGGV